MARSLNKVMLIGNLTRDPEMRYTPQGTAVCTFGLATNRTWTTDSGDKKEDVEFHNLVAWNKLAEICAQLLKKGRKVYVEGRLSTRSWQAQDGSQKQRTEVVISDMVILDKKSDEASGELDIPDLGVNDMPVDEGSQVVPVKADKKQVKEKVEEEVSEEDIPF
jgi:single-strand DNA-binding protein